MKIWKAYASNHSDVYEIVAKFKTVRKARALARKIEELDLDNAGTIVRKRRLIIRSSCGDLCQAKLAIELLKKSGAAIIKTEEYENTW